MILRLLPLVVSVLLQVTGSDRWEEVILLQKVKRHLAEETKQLPNYTCLQTVERFRQAGGKKGEMRADTVVLEVMNTGKQELFASPGSRAFSADNPTRLTAGGLTGTGSFGMFLRTLFVNDHGTFQYRGEEQFRGRRAIRWDYRVSRMWSGFAIRFQYAHGVVGMKGSFTVDPETLDLLWLSVHADDIPPNLPLLAAVQWMEYAPMRIGDRTVTLPQSGAMEFAEPSGEVSRNFFEFTHCRSFRAESTISFTPPADAGSGPAEPAKEISPVGPGLTVTVELAAPLTSANTVGSVIAGRAAADVQERRKTIISAGAPVRGRIRRLERIEDGYWAVGIEFNEIETVAGPARFYANILELDKQAGAQFLLRLPVRGKRGSMGTEERWLPYLPGVAQFFVPGSQLNVPKGFKTRWKTTSPR
jgi:hypothetical protein